ncbi:sulfatase [Pedobacter sp. BS3]|uniref:sulfatase n=1 Tax=Pedobacter sp. BS3 TaxID=2567937 RepID=UPI0011EDC355|nr:sulfatase [Pedobacter sp. BS3]TZF81331.1 sulfatase [Pedobacter sp. BS3]
MIVKLKSNRLPGILSLLLFITLKAYPANGVPSSRPNVLFIVTDDMNDWSLLKNYPVLKTPAIDKLASQSYYFYNASCAAPVCIPSRASFFSGMYPYHTGAYLNNKQTWFKGILQQTETLPETFKKSGYTTWAAGKTFHVEVNNDREKQMFDNTAPKGGFGPYAAAPFWYGKSHWFSIKPWTGPDSDFPDVRNADSAITFLKQKHAKPFFMYYGLWRPHTPYTAPKRFYDLYKDEDITLPPGYLENDLDDVPQLGRDLVDSMSTNKYFKQGLTKKEVWLKMLKAYCANTSFADWNIGRVMAALDNSPYAENTIVIFCSDNGFHNGVKDHWVKATLWEQADVIPFLVRLPGGKAYRCPQTVSLVDIYPTLVEYCNLTPPDHKLDGISLVPVLKNPKAKWERPGVTVYGPDYSSVRTERYRYIRYADGSEELYDHESDPYEHTNLARRADMKPVIQQLAKYVPQKFAKSWGGRHEKEIKE